LGQKKAHFLEVFDGNDYEETGSDDDLSKRRSRYLREKGEKRRTKSQACDDDVWDKNKEGHGSDDMKEKDCDFDGGKAGLRVRETDWGCGGEWEEEKEREMGEEGCLYWEFGGGV